MLAAGVGAHPKQAHGLGATVDEDDIELAAGGLGGRCLGVRGEGVPLERGHRGDFGRDGGGEFCGGERAQAFEGGGVSIVVVEIAPFVGVSFDVVKFLAAASIVDVAKALGTEGKAAGLVEVGHGRMWPSVLRIFQ